MYSVIIGVVTFWVVVWVALDVHVQEHNFKRTSPYNSGKVLTGLWTVDAGKFKSPGKL